MLEYARLLDQVEDHYGYPVDTEWALADDVFHDTGPASPVELGKRVVIAVSIDEPDVDRNIIVNSRLLAGHFHGFCVDNAT